MDFPTSLLWQAKEKARFSIVAGQVASEHTHLYMENQGIRLEQSVEPESGLLRLDLAANLLPVEIPLSVGMAVHMLRSALDTATSTLMEKAGASGASRIGFPMHETEQGLRNSFEDGKRTCPNHECGLVTKSRGAYAEIRKRIPEFEALLFDEFQPWKDGNYSLWALGKLDNIDKHRMILPTFGEVAWRGSWSAISHAGGGSWNDGCTYQIYPGQTINLARTDKSIVVEDPGVFSTKLIFESGIPLGGVPVFEALRDLTEIVQRIIETLEAKFI